MTSFPSRPRLTQHLGRHGFFYALALAFLYLCLRNTGPYPLVFTDEWQYSKFARLLPLAEASVPSYLYLALFRLTAFGGDAYLQLARLLNAALFVGAAPLIYLVARPLLSRRAAAAVAVFSVLAPSSSYTAYFMPEASYFFGFWLLTWAVLRAGAPARWHYGLLCGALLGMLSLVKVHALFLLPALCLFLAWASRAARPAAWRRPAVQAVAGAVAAAFATKLALAYLLAGPVGLSLLGSFYGGHAGNSGHGLGHLLAPALHNLRGHLLALLLLYAFPLLVLASACASGAVRAALGRSGRALQLYTVLMLGAALAMTVAYTASIASAGPQEGIRLHLRYYDFTFPLLLIGAAAGAAHGAAAGPRLRAALALPLAALLLYAARHLVPAYASSLIDCPELFALLPPDGSLSPFGQRPAAALLIGLQLALLAWWVWQPKRGGQFYLWLLLPLATVNGEAVNNIIFRHAQQANDYDLAGRFAHVFLDRREREELAVAGSDLAGLSRAQFHIDSAGAAQIELPEGAPLQAAQAPAQQRWLLVVGQHALPAGWRPVASTPHWALLRLSPMAQSLHQIRFSQALGNGVLERVEGLAEREDWGAWSNGKRVTLRFSQALPAHMSVLLSGRAFGPNVGQPFSIEVGGVSRQFTLPATAQDLLFEFDSDGRQRQLSITVPQPATPASLGLGGDQRALGLGLIRLEIGTGAARRPDAP